MNKPENTTHDMYGNEISFDGNPNLKRCGTKINYSPEQILEYRRCAESWEYFAQTYYQILSLKEGMIHPILRDYQRTMINSYINNRFTIVLASRQSGKSTSYEIFLCWTILFNKDQRVGILANKVEISRDILRKVKEAYELLPHWLTQGIKVWNSGSIKLENGSMVIASSTSSTAIRGKSIGLLVVDERAFIPQNIWDSFISSVYPTISSSDTSKVIYVSTPCGLNHFYKDWMDAKEKKNQFNPIQVDWWEVPDRDENWKEETIANIGPVRFAQEYANSFLGSIATLIEPEYIKDLKHKAPIEKPRLFHAFPTPFQKYVKIYEEPIKKHTYVIGVDSSKMTEDSSGDSLGMQVLDVTSFPIRQVATFYAKQGISYLQTPDIACRLGTYYNEAYMFVENNEIGQEVANLVQELEYENIYYEKLPLPGYRTTKKTKRIGTDNLKLFVENNKIVLHDFDTISQISTYIRKKNSYEAEKGYKDDLIAALLSALFFMQTKGLDIDIAEDNLELVKNILAKSNDEKRIQDEEEAPANFFLDLGDNDFDEPNPWGNDMF